MAAGGAEEYKEPVVEAALEQGSVGLRGVGGEVAGYLSRQCLS